MVHNRLRHGLVSGGGLARGVHGIRDLVRSNQTVVGAKIFNSFINMKVY